MDWRTDNACDRLLPVLGPQHNVVQRRKALPHGEVAAAIEKVRAANPGKVDTLAFEFLVLTAARGGDLRGSVERDRPGGGCVDGPREPDENRAAAPSAALWPGVGDSRRRTEPEQRRESDRVHQRAREVAGRERMRRLLVRHRIAAVPHGVPVKFPGLGSREDGTSPGGGRGGVPAHGPVRAEVSAHERLGGVSGGRALRALGPLLEYALRGQSQHTPYPSCTLPHAFG